MENTQKCNNCNSFVTKKSRFCFTSKLPKRNVSVIDALKLLLNLEVTDCQYKVLCSDCANKLGTAYHYLQQFKSNTKEYSDLANPVSVKVNVAEPTNPATKETDKSVKVNEPAPTTPTRKKTSISVKKGAATPVGKKIVQFMSSKSSLLTIRSVIRRKLRSEVNNLLRHSCLKRNILLNEDCIPSISVLVEEMNTHAPFLFKMLQGTMLRNIRPKVNEFIPEMRSVLSIILNARNKNASVFQKSVGLILFFGHASMRTFGILNKLKLSVSYKTVTRTLDNMIKHFDKKVINFQKMRTSALHAAVVESLHSQSFEDAMWEESNEAESVNEPLQPTCSTEERNTLNFFSLRNAKKRLRMEESDAFEEDDEWEDVLPLPPPPQLSTAEDKEDTRQPTEMSCRKKLKFDLKTPNTAKLYYGGLFSMDNVNHCPQSLHKSSQKKQKALNMTSTAFVFNRIPQNIDDVIKDPLVKKAIDVPLEAYLPTLAESERMKKDHIIMVKRTLVKYLPYFKSLENHTSIEWYIPHKYSKESSKKSEVINMGVDDIDENTTEGQIKLMQNEIKYFPLLRGKRLNTVVSGDCLSCDLMRSTMAHRCNSDVEEEKLTGPVPAVGQFHLRMNLLHDVVKLFIGDRDGYPGLGSLPSFIGMFGHDEKLRDVKHNFHLATRFLDFCLASYLVAAAMDVLEIPSESYVNEGQEVNEDVKLGHLEQAVMHIVNMEWMDVARNTSQDTFCICDAKYDPKDPKKYIACDNNDCPHTFWYHVDCLKDKNQNKSYRIPPKNEGKKYYCTKACEDASKDLVFAYSKSFMNCWLNFTSYRDSIRTNDGKRMHAYNKLHLIQFYNRKHPKYLRVTHLWMTQKAGWTSRNAQFDLMNNSTVNMGGKKNTNLEMDLFHEFLNRFLKSMILMQYGIIASKAVLRRSRSYQILKDLRAEWEEQLRGVDESEEQHNARYDLWKVDIQAAIEIILCNKLTRKTGKRYHPGFPNFCYDHVFIENISEYRQDLIKMSHRLDGAEKYRNETRGSTRDVVLDMSNETEKLALREISLNHGLQI